MVRKLRRALIVASALCCAAAVRAETYFSAYLGGASTRDSDLTVTQPATGSAATFSGVSWHTRSFEMPPYYGLRLDHFLEAVPRFGIGFEFNHYKVYADVAKTVAVNGVWTGAPVSTAAPLNQRVQKFNISHGVNYLGLNLLHRWPSDKSERFPHGRLQPYVGAGPVYYLLHAENAVNNVTNDEKFETSGWGYQVFAGLRYGLTARLSLMLEAKFSHGTAKVNTAGAGSAETRLDTLHGAAGLSYRF